MHSGEKPYECYVCEMRFTRIDLVRAHMRKHDDVKTPECDSLGENLFGSASVLPAITA